MRMGLMRFGVRGCRGLPQPGAGAARLRSCAHARRRRPPLPPPLPPRAARRVCGSDERPGQLICCESCPAVYHAACAGLEELPGSEWFCPECSKALTLENVERLLDVRVIGAEEAAAAASAAEAEAALKAAAEAAAGGGDGAAPPPLPRHARGGAAKALVPQDGPKEYYVKWKERSYLHCSWVPAEMFERAIRLGLVYMRTRLRKFHGERDAAAAAFAAMAAEDEESGATPAPFVDEGLKHGVHPAWLQARGGRGRAGVERGALLGAGQRRQSQKKAAVALGLRLPSRMFPTHQPNPHPPANQCQVDRVLAERPATGELPPRGAPALGIKKGSFSNLLSSIAAAAKAAKAGGGGGDDEDGDEAGGGGGGGGGGGVEYLVKWKDLDHGSATWERAEVRRWGPGPCAAGHGLGSALIRPLNAGAGLARHRSSSLIASNAAPPLYPQPLLPPKRTFPSSRRPSTASRGAPPSSRPRGSRPPPPRRRAPRRAPPPRRAATTTTAAAARAATGSAGAARASSRRRRAGSRAASCTPTSWRASTGCTTAACTRWVPRAGGAMRGRGAGVWVRVGTRGRRAAPLPAGGPQPPHQLPPGTLACDPKPHPTPTPPHPTPPHPPARERHPGRRDGPRQDHPDDLLPHRAARGGGGGCQGRGRGANRGGGACARCCNQCLAGLLATRAAAERWPPRALPSPPARAPARRRGCRCRTWWSSRCPRCATGSASSRRGRRSSTWSCWRATRSRARWGSAGFRFGLVSFGLVWSRWAAFCQQWPGAVREAAAPRACASRQRRKAWAVAKNGRAPTPPRLKPRAPRSRWTPSSTPAPTKPSPRLTPSAAGAAGAAGRRCVGFGLPWGQRACGQEDRAHSQQSAACPCAAPQPSPPPQVV
jgi:hypothetical protein